MSAALVPEATRAPKEEIAGAGGRDQVTTRSASGGLQFLGQSETENSSDRSICFLSDTF